MSFNFKVQVSLAGDHESKVPKNYEYESRRSSTEVQYLFDLELRDWGIKNFIFIVPNQTIEFEVELQSQKEPYDCEYVTFRIKLDEVETQLPDNFSAGDIKPDHLDLLIEELVKVNDNLYEGSATGVLSFDSTEL